MIKNIFKLKNLSILIALAGLAYGGYYFGTQNTDTSSSNKTLELTTVAIQKGDLEKKEEYNGTLRNRWRTRNFGGRFTSSNHY